MADDLVWDADDMAVLQSPLRGLSLASLAPCPLSEGHAGHGGNAPGGAGTAELLSSYWGHPSEHIFASRGPRSRLKPCPALLQGWVIEEAGARG